MTMRITTLYTLSYVFWFAVVSINAFSGLQLPLTVGNMLSVAFVAMLAAFSMLGSLSVALAHMPFDR